MTRSHRGQCGVIWWCRMVAPTEYWPSRSTGHGLAVYLPYLIISILNRLIMNWSSSFDSFDHSRLYEGFCTLYILRDIGRLNAQNHDKTSRVVQWYPAWSNQEMNTSENAWGIRPLVTSKYKHMCISKLKVVALNSILGHRRHSRYPLYYRLCRRWPKMVFNATTSSFEIHICLYLDVTKGRTDPS